MVFVLDRHKKPLMPCTPKRARLLLAQRRAVVHRVQPFTIRLKDRLVKESSLQPLALKIDPGSKVTGMTLVRVEPTASGEVHHAVHLAEVQHRGKAIQEQLQKRVRARRRRRSVNLRYRQPRWNNRRRPKGWLPPSLRSRVDNVLTWARRYLRWVPVTRIEIEHVKFDTQYMQDPEITGVAYHHGTLAGWELRAYVLEKFQYHCAYCHTANGPFELDHILPKSRGGSDRVSNLCLACHACNTAKGNMTAAEFGHPDVETQAKAPLRDAAAVNATRHRLVIVLSILELPIGTWSGGRTRWNRARFGIEKTHSLDALCVGDLAGVQAGRIQTLRIIARGRGLHRRTLFDEYGFPRGFLMRRKQVRGFRTGDLVAAVVPAHLKSGGVHRGRVAVKANGAFTIGKISGINAKYCRIIQRGDGYDYDLLS